MDDWNKTLKDLNDGLNTVVDKTAKFIDSSTKDLSGTMEKERRKMELRSQIGQHQRAVQKAYERIGEAYVAGKNMTEMKDVIDLVNSNNKLISLLDEQLKALEG
ncbi:MAG: hypothetical protein LKF79_07900 [Solobacterium sp.]|jgi:vacuolar-type H+-ATPase subunit I/STV1|nr:hypothetical protein [Solobacterium sp.]